MADLLAQATGFSILVLEGPLQGQNIFLEGRALPYQGVAYPTEARVRTTWYPGNPVATQQKTGPILRNTVIQGAWKDVFLGDGQARALVRTFEDLVRTAVDIEVSWGVGLDESGGTTGETIVRRGIVKRIEPKFDRPQDVFWEIEFEWSGTDDSAFTPVLSAGVVDERLGFDGVADDAQQVEDATDSWLDQLNAKIAGLTDFQQVADWLDTQQNNLVAATGELESATGALTDVSDLATDVIERVTGACDIIVGSCARISAAITGYREVYYAAKDAKAAFEGMADRLKNALWPIDDPAAYLDGMTNNYDLLAKADASSESAQQQSDSVKAKQIPGVAKELNVPAGTDLRDIARDEWGDPDAWWDIADFNGLDGSRVPDMPAGLGDQMGYPIAIPVRSASRGPKPYGGAGC